MVNQYIKNYIRERYGFDVDTATEKELGMVEEIIVNDVTGLSNRDVEWDFSNFPNLRKIDCMYNFVKKLDVSKNTKLEILLVAGVRGQYGEHPDFSHNVGLKKLTVGQDSENSFDLSKNVNLEELTVQLSSSLRWLDISNSSKLKSIDMQGVNIPFVDLTNCNELEHVNINYFNLYRNKCDEYGSGFPRPFVFVNESFDENVIPQHSRSINYYTYYLVRVKQGTPEEKFLEEIKSMKNYLISLPEDRYGRGVAELHYELLNKLSELRRQG